MNIRALQHFLLLCDTLNFGRASRRANISTSALSRTVRQLEDLLSVPLFYRDNRHVALTPQGRRFQSYARQAIQLWEEVRQELGDSSERLQGQISLYCSVTASHSILFDLLNRFRTEHPRIEFQLQTGDPEHAIARVQAQEEDLAIAARPARLPRGILFKPILVSPLVFIAPVDTRDTGLTEVPPKGPWAWQDVPMILPSGGLARQRVDTWFRSLGVTPSIYAQVAGNEAIVSMTSLGLGIGVVPQIVLENSPLANKVRTLDIKPALAPYDLGLVTLKRNLGNPVVEAFWSLLPERQP